jgi:Domain of unknown function (DUF4268)
LTLEGNPEFAIGTDHYVDIVARNGWNERVAVENQFGKSDADHLGRGLVYLSNIGATTLIWVTEKLRDPHRETLAWLNQNTPETFGFFGVEIEALTIDGSNPGVRFNVVVRPNNWRRRASKPSNDGPATEEQVWLRKYWTAFAEFLENAGASDWMRELPRDKYWGGEVGHAGFRIFGIVNRKERWLEVQLDVRHAELDRAIDLLQGQRGQIESELGPGLDWRRKPQSFQIALQNRDVDPAETTTWQNQHEWLLSHMKDFRRTFKDRIAAIGADTPAGVAQSDNRQSEPVSS